MAKEPTSSDASENEEASQVEPTNNESYRVLARKYRPESFNDLIGQEPLVQTLTNAFSSGRIAQAYMLTGVRGVGKTTTARLIARGLNYDTEEGIDGPTLDFAKEGLHCRAILESRHIDVLEMDAASNTGIDDVREIIESVRYAPVSSRYKVYIIDEVHMLSRQAFNGLLKTLEEPPPHVKFIFATTEIRKVPVTVLSRCQRFDLRRVEGKELFDHFSKIASAEKVSVEEEALHAIIRASEGSVRDGLSLLDQAIAHGGGTIKSAEVQNMLGLSDRARIADLADMVFSGNIKAVLDELKSQFDFGADPAIVLADLAEFVHALTKTKIIGEDALREYSQDEISKLKELSEKLSLRSLARAWQILLKGMDEVELAINNMAAAEMVLIRLSHSADMPTPDELVTQYKEQQGDGNTSVTPMPTVDQASTSPSADNSPASPPTMLQEDMTPPISALAIEQDQPTHVEPSSIQINSYAEIVSLARGKRDIGLCHELENHVRLVNFESGRLEISLEKEAKTSTPNELSRKLEQWTGLRWIVAVSKQTGAATLAETKRLAKQKRIEAVRSEPLVEATLATFPGAEIIDVTDAIKMDTDSE